MMEYLYICLYGKNTVLEMSMYTSGNCSEKVFGPLGDCQVVLLCGDLSASEPEGPFVCNLKCHPPRFQLEFLRDIYIYFIKPGIKVKEVF